MNRNTMFVLFVSLMASFMIYFGVGGVSEALASGGEVARATDGAHGVSDGESNTRMLVFLGLGLWVLFLGLRTCGLIYHQVQLDREQAAQSPG